MIDLEGSVKENKKLNSLLPWGQTPVLCCSADVSFHKIFFIFLPCHFIIQLLKKLLVIVIVWGQFAVNSFKLFNYINILKWLKFE